MKDQSEYNVRAVERALLILDCFDSENPERGVSEIAQAVDLHKATTHRIVTTLLNYGYLERTDDDQRYRLGLKLASLGCQVIDQMDLRQEALPYMTHLVEQWNETCDLSIFDQERVFYVEVLHGNHALTISAAVGQRLPAYCTASGKLFLAYLPPDKLRAELETIRQRGYSFDEGELEDGIRAVAAPIRNHRGEIIATISIPGPVNRITPERIPEILASLVQTTQAISNRLGWQI